MDAQKLTQKSLEAVGQAQSLAIEHSNMQIEQEHLFLCPADTGEWADSTAFQENGD